MKDWNNIDEKTKRMLIMGEFKCNGCKQKIRHGQYKYYVPNGNLYHDTCSRGIEGRIKIA